MKTKKFVFSAVLLLVSLTGCMEWDYGDYDRDIELPAHGLFIVNEGNFQYGNSTLSFYDPRNETVQNELFIRANSMKLGDVGQSMCMHGDKAWIVVNNSHVVFAVDPTTVKEKGRIGGFTSPRYIHFINDEKAYVTQLWDNRIAIIDPRKFKISDYISVPGMDMGNGSTEQMVQIGKYVYCNCWSYQNSIIKIDTATDIVVARLEVGIQPAGLIADVDNKIWTLTDGGYEGSPYGYEAPALIRIDPESMTIERKFILESGKRTGGPAIDGAGNLIYWINDDVWRMPISSAELPDKPFIRSSGTIYYSMTIDPESGEVYVADAIDYQQAGTICRYSREGQLKDKFTVGITPGSFCWK